MAATLPHVWYANYGNGSSTGYFAISAWHQPWTPTAGTFTRQTAPTNANARVFVCIVSGAVGAVEPTWTVTKGSKTTDNACTWMECTGQPAVNGDVTNTPASSTERSQSVSLGLIIKKNTADFFFICTTAGVCGAGEPTYNTTAGQTTTDGGAVWTSLGAVGSYSIWGAPFPYLTNAVNTNWMAAGDTCYVSSAHAEVQAAAMSINAGTASTATYSSIICVANAPSATPPVAGDITTGASINSSTSNAITLQGCVYWQGVNFLSGSGSSAPTLTISSTQGGWIRLDNCTLTVNNTGASTLQIGASGSMTILQNTPVVFGGTATQIMGFGGGHVIWRDTPSALQKSAGSWPTSLFNSGSFSNGDFLIENCDLSSYAGTNWFGTSGPVSGRLVMHNCKLPSGIALNASLGPREARIDQINCDTGGNIYNHSRLWYEGQQLVNTSAVRTGGASDGTTAYSWQITTNANTNKAMCFECLPIQIWNTVTGSNRTVTIEACYVGTSLPINTDIWIDTVYYGTAGSVVGTTNSTTIATVLSSTSSWSASSATWSGSASARLANHAYVLGDLIGVSSASSIVRLFQCTTAGTSFNGAAPGAYATATDGTQVTDGTAVFTAVERFQLTTTLSAPQPQSAGYFTIYVRVGKTSGIYYVDPYVTLS